MNWKIIVGIAIGIALIAMGVIAVHSGVVKNVVNTNPLDDASGGSTEGPHPPGDTPWQVIVSTLDGPHPPGDTPWGQ